MKENNIQNEIRLALSDHGIVFRTNSGDFWQGQRVYSKEFKQDVLINTRKISGLPKGFSDLLFIGEGFVAFIEVKKPGGRVGQDQANFIFRMLLQGHRAGIAESVEDALNIIKEGYERS